MTPLEQLRDCLVRVRVTRHTVKTALAELDALLESMLRERGSRSEAPGPSVQEGEHASV